MKKQILLVIALFAALTASAFAQIPTHFTLQGYVEDDLGTAITANSVQVVFRIWDAETAGNVMHMDKPGTVNIVNGYFEYTTESIPNIAEITKQQLWYEFTIGVDAGAVTSERVKFAAVPYAASAKFADNALLADQAEPIGPAGGDLTGEYPNPTLKASAVENVVNKMSEEGRIKSVPTGPANGDIGGTYPNQLKIQDNIIRSNHISQNGVKTVNLDTGAVTLNRLAKPTNPNEFQFIWWNVDNPNSFKWEYATLPSVLSTLNLNENTVPMWDGSSFVNTNIFADAQGLAGYTVVDETTFMPINYTSNAFATAGYVDVKTATLAEQLAALQLDIETNYVTSATLNTTLADYVLDTDLETALASYVTSTDLTTALTDYVTTNSLTSALLDYYTKDAADNIFITSTDLTTTLADYVTSSALSTTLADYVLDTDLETALASYVTSATLNTTLTENYYTKEETDDMLAAVEVDLEGQTLWSLATIDTATVDGTLTKIFSTGKPAITAAPQGFGYKLEELYPALYAGVSSGIVYPGLGSVNLGSPDSISTVIRGNVLFASYEDSPTLSAIDHRYIYMPNHSLIFGRGQHDISAYSEATFALFMPYSENNSIDNRYGVGCGIFISADAPAGTDLNSSYSPFSALRIDYAAANVYNGKGIEVTFESNATNDAQAPYRSAGITALNVSAPAYASYVYTDMVDAAGVSYATEGPAIVAIGNSELNGAMVSFPDVANINNVKQGTIFTTDVNIATLAAGWHGQIIYVVNTNTSDITVNGSVTVGAGRAQGFIYVYDDALDIQSTGNWFPLN